MPVYIDMQALTVPVDSERRVRALGALHGPKNRLLLLLLPEARAQMDADCAEIQLEADAVLFEYGERVKYAYFPQDCVISLQLATRDGASVEFGMIGNEGVVGLETLFENGRAPGRAIAARAGRALRVPAQSVLRAFRQYAAFRSGLLHFYGAFNAQVVQRSICHRVHTIDEQLCTWLLLMHDRSGNDRLSCTHEAVGGFLGGRREGVSIAIRRLRRDGLVRSGYRCLVVLDRMGLEARSCECYGAIRGAYPAGYANVRRTLAAVSTRSDIPGLRMATST